MFDRTNIHWPLEVVARPAAAIDSNELERHVKELSADHTQFMAILDRDRSAVLVGGCDERQLEKNLNLLQSKTTHDFEPDPPHVGYRETISNAVDVVYTHKKRLGAAGQFARIKIVLEPLEDKFAFSFEYVIVGDAVPREYIAGVEKGISAARNEGPIMGLPLVGLKVSLVDCAYHDVDSSAIAFEIASRTAFREAANQADIALLEPILRIDVNTPTDYSDVLVRNLTNRRGAILGLEGGDDSSIISAHVPASQTFGLANSLARITNGHASYSLLFNHYQKIDLLPNDDPPWPEPIAAALRA